MWCQNDSVTIPRTAHRPSAKPPDSIAPCHAEQQQHRNMSKDQIGRPVTLHSHSKHDDLTGLLLWGGSRLTCVVKTNSPCPSSHDEDVNTFQFQQATIFTATLFQPQLITTMYIQLQMIIYKSSVCCVVSCVHTRHIREMQEIFRRTHNNKRQYFIEPFLIRSVRCKRDHVWRYHFSLPDS